MRIVIFAVLTMASVTFSGAASCAVVSQSKSFNLSAVAVKEIDFTTSLQRVDTGLGFDLGEFNQFDQTQGELTDVLVTFDGVISQTLVSVDTTSQQDVGLNMGVVTVFALAQFPRLVANFGISCTHPFCLGDDFLLPATAEAEDLSMFQGDGDLSGLRFDYQFQMAVDGGSGPVGESVFFNLEGQAVGQITVEYVYTPVPLPASLCLLGSGLFTLLASRELRFSQSI